MNWEWPSFVGGVVLGVLVGRGLVAAYHFIAKRRCWFGHDWVFGGGRSCPRGMASCSQPAYYCRLCGLDDLGEPGGPAAEACADCEASPCDECDNRDIGACRTCDGEGNQDRQEPA